MRAPRRLSAPSPRRFSAGGSRRTGSARACSRSRRRPRCRRPTTACADAARRVPWSPESPRRAPEPPAPCGLPHRAHSPDARPRAVSAAGRGHTTGRQGPGAPQRHEPFHPLPPHRLALGVEVVVSKPVGMRMPEAPGHDLAAAAVQSTAHEHRVQQALAHAEGVERDHGHAERRGLDRGRGTHRDQTRRRLQRGAHRVVGVDEVLRNTRRQQPGVRVTFPVRLRLPWPRPQLHHHAASWLRFGGPHEHGRDLGALLPRDGYERLRGEDDVRRRRLTGAVCGGRSATATPPRRAARGVDPHAFGPQHPLPPPANGRGRERHPASAHRSCGRGPRRLRTSRWECTTSRSVWRR